jgi:hypothetical protein
VDGLELSPPDPNPLPPGADEALPLAVPRGAPLEAAPVPPLDEVGEPEAGLGGWSGVSASSALPLVAGEFAAPVWTPSTTSATGGSCSLGIFARDCKLAGEAAL